jgi:hypothetical protein
MKFHCNIKLTFEAENIKQARANLKDICKDILTETKTEIIEINDDEKLFSQDDLWQK